jgi:hypothetical protein
MGTEELYFSKENKKKLLYDLVDVLDCGNDSETLKSCSQLLTKIVIPKIWGQYKNKADMYPPRKLVPYLNKKSIELSENMYNNRKSSSSSKPSKSLGQISMDREMEVRGNIKNKQIRQPLSTQKYQQPVQKYPQQRQQSQKLPYQPSKNDGFMESDFGNGGNFASYALFNSNDNINETNFHI